MKTYYVYILECSDSTFYTGVTNDVEKRFKEHQSGDDPRAYTYRRRPVKLVWFETTNDVHYAISKEKQIKKWSKAKKIALINSEYNKLIDLSKKKF